LVKRMNSLKIKFEQKKIMKGQTLEKKITDKEINTMKIDELIKNIAIFNHKLEINEITYYNVQTLMNLCQKVSILFKINKGYRILLSS